MPADPPDLRKHPPTGGQKPGSGRRYAPRRRRVLVEVEAKHEAGSFLGRQAKFLMISVLFSVAIAAAWMAWDRYVAGKAKSADPLNPAQVSMGANLYREHCAFCHGVNREGQGLDAQRGRPAPALDQSGPSVRVTDRLLFEVIKYGGQPFAAPGAKSQMPGYEFTLTNGQIWAVLAFLKNRWPEDARAAQAAINAKAESD
ncbi:MAG: c-type cytochrome [Proteobacteria bacterium]|nr:c-type cytochrome [Pseudomonadota bacterium]